MEAKLQDQIAYYLTGRRDGSGLQTLDADCRPAIFSRFSDLSSLRYDLPLVMNRGAGPDRAVLSLSRLVDEAVANLDESVDHDRVARHGYRLEKGLRQELAANGTGDFSAMWKAAAERLETEGGESVRDSANRLWKSFKANGDLIDADREFPSRVVGHVWNAIYEGKARAFRQRAERLLFKLRGVLEAEMAGSAIGRAPERLMAGVGTSFAGSFDFSAMSRILSEAKPGFELSENRRRRIRGLIDNLERQRFYPLGDDGPEPYSFTFERSSDALEEYQGRHADAVEIVKTLAIADLEVAGEYRESVHDVLFDQFGANGLDAGDLAELPNYLVCMDAGTLDPAEAALLIDLLGAGVPLKVLFRTDDVLKPAKLIDGHFILGAPARQLVDAAIGLADVFVLQSSASHLFKMQDSLIRGMSYDGPALFSVFSGIDGHTSDLPAYLVAAAAVESRAFPSLVYDPTAGSERASLFSLDLNPSQAKDWPVHILTYEDTLLHAGSEEIAFTLADLMAMDHRFAGHFAIVPETEWSDAMVPVQEALDLETRSIPEKVPFILLVDGNGSLKRAIVDRRAILETRRCLMMWKGMQDLSGARFLNIDSQPVQGSDLIVETEGKSSAAADDSPGASAALEAPAATQMSLSVDDDADAETRGDDPYIETGRCTSCNECTNINNRMFGYNSEKQAYIADADAGTFRQLVEAAEGCQVSIIHPGKPRNPKEPGIDDLIKRAAEFN